MNMRMTRKGAGILIALMMIAIPAAAAVMTQNFVSATVELNGQCFTVAAGSDDSSLTGFVTFDPGSLVSTGSVDLYQETLTIDGFAGNRMVYSDVAVFTNNCGNTVTMDFVPAVDPAGGLAFDPPLGSAIWNDLTVTFYVANVGAPGAVLTSVDWDELLRVEAGVATTPDTATIGNGVSRRMAVVIDTDVAATPLSSATLRWTAQVNHP